MKATCMWTALALMVVSLTAAAQVSDADLMQQLRTDIQAYRQALVAANLGLTEAEGEAFWRVYSEYRN